MTVKTQMNGFGARKGQGVVNAQVALGSGFRLRIGRALALMAAFSMVLAGASAHAGLTPGQVIQLSMAKYASAKSYSDMGQTISIMDGVTTTTSFKTLLARPGLYLFSWRNTRRFFDTTVGSPSKAVFCSGGGNFLEQGYGPENEGSPAVALELAAPSSSGAATAIPGVFLQLNNGNVLVGDDYNTVLLPDEEVAGVNCYVLTSHSRGRTRTLWIGKNDYLIHQLRTQVSIQSMQVDLQVAASPDPETTALLQPCLYIETISNIVLNADISPRKFQPSIAHYASNYAQ